MWCLHTLNKVNQEAAKTGDVNKAFVRCGISLPYRTDLVPTASEEAVEAKVEVSLEGEDLDLKNGKFHFILELSRQKTPAQIRQSLVDAGIITPEGELTEKYKQAE